MRLEELKKVTPFWDDAYIRDNLEEINTVCESLMSVMMQNDGLQGITAKQIGISVPIAVFQKRSGEFEFVINPEILKHNGRHESFYVCSSFPGCIAKLSRAPRIKVRYREAKSLRIKVCSLRADESFVFQYIVELMNGVLLFDKALTGVNWTGKYKKLYRIPSSTYGYNYYLQGEYKLLFGGLEVGPTAGGEVVGVSTLHLAESPYIVEPERSVIL